MSLPPTIHQGDCPVDGPLIDRFDRVHTYLRVSVTDRCNYRCTYCVPAEGVDWTSRSDVLTFEEITRLVRVFISLGIRRVRLTGGEPLVRREIVRLVESLGALEGLEDLAMTTNAHALASNAEALARAGLSRINVSLDTLDAERFKRITRGGSLERVLEGIEVARRAGLRPLKINCVIVRGENEEAVEQLVNYFGPHADSTVVRFIEAMPFVGTAAVDRFVPSSSLRERLQQTWTLVQDEELRHGGPETGWRVQESGLRLGFISAMTEHFCEACNRLRLQVDGQLRTCLSREAAPSLREALRDGTTDEEIAMQIRQRVWDKVGGHEAHLSGDDRKLFEGVMTSVGG
jgi:cyclic pyranopterin phosphate synthase